MLLSNPKKVRDITNFVVGVIVSDNLLEITLFLLFYCLEIPLYSFTKVTNFFVVSTHPKKGFYPKKSKIQVYVFLDINF